MMISNDKKGLFMSWVSTFLNSYKNVVARLQSVFVPTVTKNITISICRA